jgi:uncharacterized protein (TIGR03067 family)
VYQMSAAEPDAKPQEVKEVLAKLKGEWKAVRVEEKGAPVPEADLQAIRPRMTFMDAKFRMNLVSDNQERGMEATLKINTGTQPFEIDLSDVTDLKGGQSPPAGTGMMGIFKFEGDKLRVRFKGHKDGLGPNGNPIKRPANFEMPADDPKDGVVDSSWTLERVKP